jgi:aquaporin Z
MPYYIAGKQKRTMRKYLTELIGTFFLVLTIGLAVNGGVGILVPLAVGAALMVMVYAGGHVSGAHYNPAVTLAIWIRGKIKASDVLPYMIAQVAGAALAALAVNYIIASKMPASANINADSVRALVAEVLGTFVLAYVVLNVATARGNEGNSFYGLAIGLTVTAMAYALGPVSGGAFNPAVAIGGGIMKMAAWSDMWIYAAGCFGGAAIAALVFRFINAEDHHVPPISE